MPAIYQYWMNVSMDAFIEHRAGENGGGDWMRITETLHREFNRRTEALTMLVQGRRVYEAMESYWPAAVSDGSLPDHLRDYGRLWVDKRKVLLSRTRSDAAFNTTIVGEGALEELRRLRESEQGTIGVAGAGVATQLQQEGLLDEVLLFVHPTLLGSGRPLFDAVGEPVRGDLVEHAVFDGVTMSRYRLTPT